ncbi:PLP-dependent transferase [Epithele typhae]|uniref:PLP-dependent transferase n=1 Tax=Epithele typhae TaxID=378194 RepID=UPI0020076DD2|nr:PLP-dependent transferase [Epithele typhae]KAH9943153.1 PLP-dependent transferase [Epithele typhae]
MQYSEKRPLQNAVDLSHHLSDLALSRATSPLKGLARYFGREGIISLAGGMPNPDYFPFANISGDALIPDSFAKTASITVPKYPVKPTDVNLAVALQYGTATGLPQLQKAVNEFVETTFQPAYADWKTLLVRAITTLCNPGELFITEDWTYPSALANSKPYHINPVGVPMDEQGMRPDALRKMLAEWDDVERGHKRPHVMYTVPIGQNPTGISMGLERKKEIYDICVQYDIIIVEDDPYYFLQMGEYVAKSMRSSQVEFSDSKAWIASLEPSYLKIDYQGRVIRLDTFSKNIAPGARLGYFTCNPRFAERLERAGETTTQAPCGFGQALVAQLLTTWGYDGYARWLQGLAVQYKARRDFLLDALSEEFSMRESVGTAGSWTGCTVYTASVKPKRFEMYEKTMQQELFSIVPPSAGMFLWVRLHFENIPGFKSGDEASLEMKFWEQLAEAGVLVGPGTYFASDADDVSPVEGHLRIAFSYASQEEMIKAVKIYSDVIRKFFQEAH